MTISKQIEMARKCLTVSPEAYARMLSASIRSAVSDKAANAYRAAIHQDGTERMFRGLDTNCPVAA